MVLVAGGDVSKAPKRFELEAREVDACDEGKQSWEDVSINHALDGWIRARKEATETSHCKEELFVVFSVEVLKEDEKVRDVVCGAACDFDVLLHR